MTRVLIVDDEPQILRASSITLKARAYDVVVAVNGLDKHWRRLLNGA